MKYTHTNVDLGLRQHPYVRTAPAGEKVLVELSFQKQMKRKGAEHSVRHDVSFLLTDVQAACVARTMIRATKRATDQIITNAEDTVGSLGEALNE